MEYKYAYCNNCKKVTELDERLISKMVADLCCKKCHYIHTTLHKEKLKEKLSENKKRDVVINHIIKNYL